MAKIWGKVKGIAVGRDSGRVFFRLTANGQELPGAGNLQVFYVYLDGQQVDAVDPTELVKRNLIFTQLDRAFTQQYETQITHDDPFGGIISNVLIVTTGYVA